VKNKKYVGFEVFTAVVMKSIIFWDVTLCSPLSCNSTDHTASHPRRWYSSKNSTFKAVRTDCNCKKAYTLLVLELYNYRFHYETYGDKNARMHVHKIIKFKMLYIVPLTREFLWCCVQEYGSWQQKGTQSSPKHVAALSW
jgi:hypothetical protein